MRLLICDGDQTDIHNALSGLNAPGASVLINPQWLKPDAEERLWVACGKPALDMVQAAGWIPKKGGIVANRGKLFEGIQPDGWTSPISLGVTYAPQIRYINYSEFVLFQTDIATYRRYETTGSMLPTLGHYTYAPDASGVIRYLKARYAQTGEPVELSLDTETEGLVPFDLHKNIVCVQLSAKEGIADVVYTLDQIGWSEEEGAYLLSPRLETFIGQLQWIFSQPWIKVIGANLKYDMLWLRQKWGLIISNFAFDTCNGGSLCEENRPNTLSLHTKVYSPELGGYDDPLNTKYDKSKMGLIPKADLLPYAGGDADACLRNYRKIRQELLQDNLTHNGKPAKNSLASVYLNIVHPTLKALSKMEYTGVCVDVEKFHEFGADLEGRMVESMKEAAKVLPQSILQKHGGITEQGGAPLSKPNMIAEFLFSPTGLNLEPLEVTAKTGKPSTSQHHLAQFKDHPEAAAVIERYLDYKRVSKMHGTYYKGFLTHLRSDGRWHPSYIIHKQGAGKNNEQDASGTVTGRGSATSPAFQCVSGDAEILTDTGIRTAAEIIDPLIPDDTRNPFKAATITLSGSTGMQTATRVFKSWRGDLLRVILENGNELKCTPEHPFKVSTGEWVRAKDLDRNTYLRVPEPQRRAPAPDWADPGTSALLGLIGAAGNVQMTAPIIYIELPEMVAGDAQSALEDAIGCEVSADIVDGNLVLSYSFDDCKSLKSKLFTLSLPTPDYAGVPLELRGTDAIPDYMRGFLNACGRTPKGKTGWLTLTAMTTRLDIARAIQREFAIEGVSPPRIRKTTAGYHLKWSANAARRAAEMAGWSELGWGPSQPSSPKSIRIRGLRVSEVLSAGAGWVYDFTVPDIHDFYANGMLVHNTVPKHSYWGQRLRECIIAPPGYRILSRDYSQGELKVAACWANETKMIEAYLNGIDLHTLTAATVNGMSYEEALFLKKQDEAAYKTLRQSGKAGNFGLLYGMSAFGFMMYAEAAYGVKLTLEEAEHMRNAFFDLYPMLPFWHDKQIMEARQFGYVRSPLGRLRHLPTINSPIKKVREGTQNQAINSPIQGTLVDMLWMSMGIIEEKRPELLTPFAQVHDEGLWYYPEDREDEAIAYSGEIMENLPFEEKFGWTPALKFTSDAAVGENLASLVEL